MATRRESKTDERPGEPHDADAEVLALRNKVSELERQLAAATGASASTRLAGLAANEAPMRALMSALLDPTVTIDAFGTIQAASDSVRRVFGYEAAELIGQNIRVLMPEPHRSAHDGYLENYRRTGATHILNRTREFQVMRRDGSLVTCELSVARAEWPGNSGPLFIGSFRDVTERIRSERAVAESERRFRGLFDQAFQFVWLLNPDGTVLEVNRAALESCGIDRATVVGAAFTATRWWSHSADVRTRVQDAVRSAATNKLERFEVSQRGRGTSIVEVDFSIKPIPDESGAVVLLIAEARDVTESKSAQRAETAMLRALATIGESSALLAHEIKNPLTAVNLALRAVADQLGEDHRVVLTDLAARMQHLEQLMRRTLTFARPLRLQRGDCDARALLERVVTLLVPQASGAGARLTVECEADVELSADAALLGEVLTNLVTNAIEAGARHIVLSGTRSGRSGVLLCVDDDGPGVPAAKRDTCFRPFETSKTQGTGLGLAICRKIVEEHGGTIAVEDSRLGGARFVVRLPRGETK